MKLAKFSSISIILILIPSFIFLLQLTNIKTVALFLLAHQTIVHFREKINSFKFCVDKKKSIVLINVFFFFGFGERKSNVLMPISTIDKHHQPTFDVSHSNQSNKSFGISTLFSTLKVRFVITLRDSRSLNYQIYLTN